jgi:signal recognition particle subunit SEC65
MAIACRAFRIQKSDFSRIYLMTHRMRSKGRVVNHKDMLDVLSYFDKVRPEAAARIVRRSAVQA